MNHPDSHTPVRLCRGLEHLEIETRLAVESFHTVLMSTVFVTLPVGAYLPQKTSRHVSVKSLPLMTLGWSQHVYYSFWCQEDPWLGGVHDAGAKKIREYRVITIFVLYFYFFHVCWCFHLCPSSLWGCTNFIFYRIIGNRRNRFFLSVSGVEILWHHQDMFRFRRPSFYSQRKSKVVDILTKVRHYVSTLTSTN